MTTPTYTIQNVPGKGKGLVANTDIPRGTRILSETPIITAPENVRFQDMKRVTQSIIRQVNALHSNQRRTFLSMPNIHPYSNPGEQYLGIFQTVALPIQDEGIGSGVFLTASRINHACDNNAQKHWNSIIKKYTIHALRDIPKGEEITIYYIGKDTSRSARQTALQAGFKFTCTCKLCSLPEAQSKESDKRLAELDRLDNLIRAGGISGILSSPLQRLHYANQRLSLYNLQNPHDAGKSQVFFDAAEICIVHGDLARGSVMMQRAVDGWRIAQGDDSEMIHQYGHLVSDPSKHECYGLSPRWKTDVSAIPTDLSQEEFENWLWRRDEPKTQQPSWYPTNLRDTSTFPAFRGLPFEFDHESEYLDGNGERPARHWCYLGSIKEGQNFIRLVLHVEDVDGDVVRLAFYTDGKGKEVEPTLLKKGYTIAVLYAEHHGFLDGSLGIRHEEPSLLKIFPISLEKLLALNDTVQEFSSVVSGMKKCHGCGKTSASLVKCGRCEMFWYCGQECQRTGWKVKGHKNDCKLLKDTDLKGLFLRDWDVFTNPWRFPLAVVDG